MKRISILFLGAFCLLLINSIHIAGQSIPVPTSVIRVVEGSVHAGEVPTAQIGSYPIIDGKLDDFCWEKASRVSGFYTLDNRWGINQQTTVYFLYDNQYKSWNRPVRRIYIGFKCYNSQMDKLKRIGGNYEDMRGYYIERVTPLFFGIGGKQLDPHWEYQHSFAKDYWTEERGVVVSELLEREPNEGDTLRLNLFRDNGVFDENSKWSGILVFGGASDPVCEISTFGDLSMGENTGEIKVINNSRLPVTVEATIEIFPLSGVEYTREYGRILLSDYRPEKLASLQLSDKPYSFPNQISLKGREMRKANVEYTVKEEGDHYLTFTLSNPKTKVIYYRTGFIFTITPNKKNLTDLRMRLAKLKGLIPFSPEGIRRGLENELGILEKELRRLDQEAAKTPTKGGWQLLTEKVEELDRNIGKFQHKIGSYKIYTREWNQLEYGLGIETNLAKLRRDKPFSGEISNSVRISGCGNEYEGFQLVIFPFEKDLEKIEVKVTDLVNKEKGTKISGENIEINAVGYVRTKRPGYEVEYIGWWPDPIVPLEKPYFSDVKADQMLQPIWVTVYIPPDTPAGEYQGEVTVSPSNSHPLGINLMVKVWSFDISTTPHIREFFRFTDDDWCASAVTGSELDIFRRFYNKELTPELYREWCAFHLKYRIGQPNVGLRYVSKIPGPDGSNDYSIVDRNLEFCIKRGLNVFDLIGMFYMRGQLSPEGLKETVDFLVDYSKHLKEKGWFKYAVVEPYNEASPEITKYYHIPIKEAIPDLKILQKGGSDYYSSWRKGEKSPLTGIIDVWCPGDVPPALWDEAIKERHAAGDECWAYHNYLDSRIERPTINLRKIHWRAWARKLDGLAFWATMEWEYNQREGEEVENKWPYRPWEGVSPYGNGDGHLIYPGPEGHPLSSIRLEIIRDSEEDYEYLYTLRELTQKLRESKVGRYQDLINESEKLLDIDNSLAEPVSSEKLYQLREQIALQIEKIKGILK